MIDVIDVIDVIDSENQSNKQETRNREPTLEQINMRNMAVQQCYDWFEKDRQAKQPYNAEMDEMYKIYKSEHWDLLDANGRVLRTAREKQNHPNTVENIAFALIEGLVAEFAEPKELVDYPTEPADEEMALVMTELKEFIAYKNRLDIEYQKWLRNFFLYGTGIYSRYYDPSWKGGRGPNRWNGEIRWKSEHPRSIFPDARCMESAEDGRRIHKAIYWCIEDVEETWPDTGKGITADIVSDEYLIPDELENTMTEATEDQVLVVDTWYRGSPLILEGDEQDEGPGMHLIQWAGDGSNLRYLAHQNYVYFEPGEDTTWPIDMKKCYERERSPWGIGEAYYLKNPQIMLNKTSEMIMEGHLYHSIGQTWYQIGALSPKQEKLVKQKGTLPGMWFQVQDINGIKREHGQGVPASLVNEPARFQKVMETTVGRFDISQGKTPGNITAFRALDLLASRAQVRLRSKEMTINIAFEDAGNYINRLITLFYDTRRRYRILGKDDSKPKYGVYDPAIMQKAYIFDTDESIPLSELESLIAGQDGLPEKEQLIEGRDYEIYCPEFDTKCKITQKLPTDRAFYMDMAKELFVAQLIDEETFWYAITYGKFPPIEQLTEKVRQKQETAEQQTQQEQMAMQFIEQLKANDPEMLKQIGQLPQEQQLPALMSLMQQGQQMLSQQPQLQPQQQIPQLPGGMPTSTEQPQVLLEADGQRIKQELIDIVQSQG
jgi:hypothetical protein